jgi:hypothetical protein
MTSDAAALHPDVRSLAFLLGTWRGEGKGDYPTIDAFSFGEEITVDHVGDAFLRVDQRSWLLDDGSPLHFERGFLRPGAGDEWELTLAHPLGLTEIAHGRRDGRSFEFRTGPGGVGRTRTGMAVTGLIRRFEVDGDRWRSTMDMATDDTPMTRHLAAELQRVG